MIRCFNAARPEGRESDRRVAARRTDRRCRFNAARPEGRESVPLQRRHPLLHDGLQCCPPRRAGVGGSGLVAGWSGGWLHCCPPRRAGVGYVEQTGSEQAPLLQCCPPRRAGVGSYKEVQMTVDNLLQCCPPRRAGVGGRTDRQRHPATPLQCCPPRRAGVGWSSTAPSSGSWSFNAARPEGRESGAALVGGEVV